MVSFYKRCDVDIKTSFMSLTSNVINNDLEKIISFRETVIEAIAEADVNLIFVGDIPRNYWLGKM